jgi:hypothetical protein
MAIKLRYSVPFIAAGAIAFAVGCSSTDSSTADGGDAPPPTDSGTDSIVPETGDDTLPPDSSPPENPDYSTPTSDVLLRFVAGTSELATGTDFDICWKQDSTAATYNGPIAKALSASFTAPEITKFFSLTGIVADKPVMIRLVKKDSANCDLTSRFKSSSGFDLAINDDKTHNLKVGYNTAVIWGQASATNGYSLNSFVYQDPTAKATSPTVQFFQSLSGATLSLTLKDSTGAAFTLSGGADLAYGSYFEIGLGKSYTSAVDIKSLDFAISGGTTFTFNPAGYSMYNGYYWMIAYDTVATPKAYVCTPQVQLAKTGDVVQTGCTLVAPAG